MRKPRSPRNQAFTAKPYERQFAYKHREVEARSVSMHAGAGTWETQATEASVRQPMPENWLKIQNLSAWRKTRSDSVAAVQVCFAAQEPVRPSAGGVARSVELRTAAMPGASVTQACVSVAFVPDSVMSWLCAFLTCCHLTAQN